MGASDPMLLTLPRPAKAEFEFRHAHDFLPPPPSPLARLSFKSEAEARPSLSATLSETMSTPHRSLPPPLAMTLPDPGRSNLSLLPTSFAGMPEPPRSSDESMRSWLSTKAEEEKRKQEEERTRQESFKLEQRRIEQNMLLDALRNGVPPQLIPLIFASIGSSAVANLSIEWLQQYNNTLQAAQHQQISNAPQVIHSPDGRRAPPGASFTSQPQAAIAGGSAPAQQGPSPYGYHSGSMSPSSAARQAAGPSANARAPLIPRLATNEQHAVAPPPLSGGPPSGGAVQPPPQSHATTQEQSQASPTIYFHHYVPPSSQGGNPPTTPSEYIDSPKKRKSTTAQTALPPTSEPRYNSSSFVHVGSPATSTPGGRKRRLSETSTSNRGSHTSASSKKNRSRGNTESSVAISEDDRLRYRAHYPLVSAEDRSDTTGSYGSSATPIGNGQPAKRSRRSYDIHTEESRPTSPKREHQDTSLSSRKSSYGPAGR